MKILLFHYKINENLEIRRIPCQNHENHENLIIPHQNNENHEIHIIIRQNNENHKLLHIAKTKIMKFIKFHA